MSICTSTDRCANDGVCEYSYDLSNDICTCRVYLDPGTRCQQTIFDYYKNYDLVYPVIFTLISVFYIGLYIYEINKDRQRTKRVTKMLLAKSSQIIFLISRVVLLMLWFISSIQKSFDLGVVYTAIDHLGITLLVLCDTLLIITWFEMILRAKHINDISNNVKLVNSILIKSSLVIVPLCLILQITGYTLGYSVLSTISLISIAILIFIVSIVSIIYIRIITLWSFSIDNSNAIKKITFKMRWIGYSRIVYLYIAIYLIGTKGASSLPEYYIVYQVFNRLLELILVSVMFIILENNTLRLLKIEHFENTETGTATAGTNGGSGSRQTPPTKTMTTEPTISIHSGVKDHSNARFTQEEVSANELSTGSPEIEMKETSATDSGSKSDEALSE